MIKYDFSFVKTAIKNRRGQLLDKTYVNNKTKLKVQCDNCDFIWTPTFSKIQQGQWCPYCVCLARNTLQDAQKLAKKKNGKCLSKKYTNNKTKMLWECNKCKYQWEATYGDIQQNHWCPNCTRNAKKSIQDAQKLAESKNGKCLSKKYTNNGVKIEWQCEKGHKWEAVYRSIQHGHWCPKCNISKMQIQLSNILSKLIGESPITIRPQWLKNPETNCSLEIDIYFPKHKIAIEYNGRQHYQLVDFAGKGEEWAETQLKQIQARDKLKRILIKQNPDKIKHFIIFTYRNIIEEENVKNILIKKKVIN